MGVTLGTSEPLGSEEEEGGQNAAYLIASGHQDASSEGEDNAMYEGGLTSSDEEEPQAKPGKAAYFGMQRKQNDADDAGKQYEGLDLAEQEALALRLIHR